MWPSGSSKAAYWKAKVLSWFKKSFKDLNEIRIWIVYICTCMSYVGNTWLHYKEKTTTHWIWFLSSPTLLGSQGYYRHPLVSVVSCLSSFTFLASSKYTDQWKPHFMQPQWQGNQTNMAAMPIWGRKLKYFHNQKSDYL